MEGQPLKTRTVSKKKGEVFKFDASTFQTTSGSYVFGVKLQVRSADFRYAFDNEPRNGFQAMENTILELSEKEARAIAIAPVKANSDYIVVYNVYIK